jgi:hypothetical protein
VGLSTVLPKKLLAGCAVSLFFSKLLAVAKGEANLRRFKNVLLGDTRILRTFRFGPAGFGSSGADELANAKQSTLSIDASAILSLFENLVFASYV